MRFTQDLTSGVNVIRAYAPGEIRINTQQIRGSVIVTATAVLIEPTLVSVADLSDELATRILGLSPELVLVGTGLQQTFPVAAFGAKFMRAGVGYEVMNTGAACRTFNVLVAEQRLALAVLIV
ncbi:MAG: Mth938-like domain-containing protein [Steroidobacteraceae bacterium]|jgi:uncharacterized protein